MTLAKECDLRAAANRDLRGLVVMQRAEVLAALEEIQSTHIRAARDRLRSLARYQLPVSHLDDPDNGELFGRLKRSQASISRAENHLAGGSANDRGEAVEILLNIPGVRKELEATKCPPP